MIKAIQKIAGFCLIVCLTLTMSNCNDEDDVIDIFTGKTWKMSRLTENRKNPPQFYNGIWSSEKDRLKSMEFLSKEGNFTVVFEGSEVNGEVDGSSVIIRGINSTLRGTWKANGKNNSIKLYLKKIEGSENDPLAKAFINAMQQVFQYEGDINQLTLFYQQDSNITRKIGFVKQ